MIKSCINNDLRTLLIFWVVSTSTNSQVLYTRDISENFEIESQQSAKKEV